MRTIVFSGQYKKDLKLARKRNLPESELNDVIFKLANDIPLSADKHDHSLSGYYSRCRECHIQPDWLLIYEKEDNGVDKGVYLPPKVFWWWAGITYFTSLYSLWCLLQLILQWLKC